MVELSSIFEGRGGGGLVGSKNVYSRFDEINGQHPLQGDVDDFCVLYDVRPRSGGKVSWFNFELAEEMGLIEPGHPHKLNKELEKKLLETFALIIVNEYDLKNRKKMIQSSKVRPHKYMATRYLQLQHPNKQGKTSGDGRSIWNGCFQRNGITWDVSSCGTGATRLSPATAMKKKFFSHRRSFCLLRVWPCGSS